MIGVRNMWNIREQIITATKSQNIKIREIEIEEIEFLINQLKNKFATANDPSIVLPEEKNVLLWETLKDDESVRHKEAWRWLDDLIGNNESIMFFNPSDEATAFLFNKGDDIVSILNETFGFEFYLTNQDTEYLVCFNHHDVLIACGLARDWLNNYITEFLQPLGK
jgi:hypothetical protein